MTNNLWSKLEEQRIRRRQTVDLLTRLEELCGDRGDLAGRDLYDDDVVDAIARIKELLAAIDDIVQYISRADYYNLKDKTREILER